MEIAPGAFAEVEWTVTPDRTAAAMGNPGVDVFATPWLIALLEQAASAIIMPHLPRGASTVGTMVAVKHLAATPLGMRVRARATLLERDGHRFVFAVEAWDSKDRIAEGRHERSVVANLAAFLARAAQKGQD